MLLKANLKKFYFSPWFYILFAPSLFLAAALYLSSNHMGGFVHKLPIINVFLTALVPIFSVYAAQSIREAEWSIKSRALVIANGIAAAAIFCFSFSAVPIIFIVLGCIQKGVSAALGINYILFTLASSAAQIIFLSPLGFLLGMLIKNKAAYVVAVLFSLPLTPFLQSFLLESADKKDISFMFALTCLLNLSLDDPSRVKYTGYGMPFNGETMLSWIITLLCGSAFVILTLAFKKCFKLKGISVLCLLLAADVFSGAYCTELYFAASPLMDSMNYEGDGDTAPIKIDTANGYFDPDSPVVTRCNMQLDTGNTVKNLCELELRVNGNSRVKFKLDRCFELQSLTVDGQSSPYGREGDFLTVELDPLKETSVITAEYAGRLNYADNLHNKTDVCDYTGGFLSELFAWYPKLLSAQNTEQPKDFTVEINAVNSFVTNLDGYALHPPGKQIIRGEKKEILFYLGYIGETEKEDIRVILPLNYLNSPYASKRIELLLSSVKKNTENKTYKNLFIHRYDGPYPEDFKSSETTMISYEELILFINDWMDSVNAGENQRKAANRRIAALENMWDDSLAEKLNDPAYSKSEEIAAVNALISVLSDIWASYTFGVSPEDIKALDTMVLIPFSYNVTGSMYFFENCIVASEGCIE